MNIQTFSIIAGSEACNARCPFCISKMTVTHGLELSEPEVNWRNFHKACQLAKLSDVTTAMFTGKGEPTLFPHQLTRYLHEIAEYRFPLIELQSNGIIFMHKEEAYQAHLKEWYRLGLSMIAISMVHYEAKMNHQVYLPHRDAYIDLSALIDLLHGHGYSVRLACVLADGLIDTVEELGALIRFAKKNGVEQLTVRPVNRPESSREDEAHTWTEKHALPDGKLKKMTRYLDKEGARIMTLMHGAVVYSINGQNLCLTDCLTLDAKSEDVRQLIFFPDGHLRYDWQYPGAILL